MRIFEGIFNFARTGGGKVTLLHGDMAGSFRLRLGVRLRDDVIHIFGVRHRSDAYRRWVAILPIPSPNFFAKLTGDQSPSSAFRRSDRGGRRLFFRQRRLEEGRDGQRERAWIFSTRHRQRLLPQQTVACYSQFLNPG